MKLAYMAELLSRNHCRGSKTMLKCSSEPRRTNTGQIEQWNKFLWTEESKSEIFRSNRRANVRQRVDERAATPTVSY